MYTWVGQVTKVIKSPYTGVKKRPCWPSPSSRPEKNEMESVNWHSLVVLNS